MSIYPPTGTLEIKNATLKIPVVDLQYTSNTAKLEANSNVVTEFSRSKKLIKYPRVALTQNALNNGYTVIQSGTNSAEHRKAWTLFNNDVTTDDQYHAVRDAEAGESNPYNPTTGYYEPDVGFEDGLGDVAGEYVYVVMPDKIKLQGVRVHPRQGALVRSAESARFMGSNDGTNWVDLGGYDNYVWPALSQPTGNFFTVDSNEYYNYIGVVWTKIKGGPGGDTVNMAEVQFYGVPEYDPEAYGTDVVVKSVPNVPNTDWLVVYYDAKDLTTMPATVTDLAGGDQNGTPGSGVSFDTTYKAFTFDGTANGKISGTHGLGTGTGILYSVSIWFKADITSGNHRLVTFGGQGTAFQSSTLVIYQNDIILDHWLSEIKTTTDVITTGVWYHVVAVHSGSGTNNTNENHIYLNGVKQAVETGGASGNSTFNLQGTSLTLGADPGGGNPFDGSIANFRLFNRALSSDEIWQLYAYQKEYFGHGDLSMTLKAGRLGIGTSEPRAALDVRGMLNISDKIESPFFKVFSIFDKMNPTVDDSHWSRSIEGTIYAGSSVIVVANVGGYAGTTGGNTWNIQYKIAGTTTWITLSDIFAYFNQTLTHLYRTRTFVWKPTEDIHFIEWRITTTLYCNADDKVDLVLVSLPV